MEKKAANMPRLTAAKKGKRCKVKYWPPHPVEIALMKKPAAKKGKRMTPGRFISVYMQGDWIHIRWESADQTRVINISGNIEDIEANLMRAAQEQENEEAK